MAAPVLSTTTPATLTKMMVGVVNFRWVSHTGSAGDHCVVTDINGNVLFESYAQGIDFIDAQRFDPIPLVNGLIVSIIDSGTIYVEYK